MKVIRLIFVYFLVISTVCMGVVAQSDSWMEKSSDSYVIEYKDGYGSDADQVLSWMQKIESKIDKAIKSDLEVEEKIHLRLKPDDQSGMYWVSSDPVRIYLLTPSENTYRDESWYMRTLGHEYLNILFWDHAIDNADYGYWSRNPSWFGEGLSEYYSYHNISDEIEQDMPPEGVEELKQDIREGNGYFFYISSNEYYGGYLLARYMLDTYGEEKIISILTEDTDSFSNAVEQNLNISYNVFREEKWLSWAEENIGGNYSDTIEDENNQKLQNKINNLKSLLEQKNNTINNLQSLLEQKNNTIQELENNTVDLDVIISTEENKTEFYSGDKAQIKVKTHSANIDMRKVNIYNNRTEYSPDKSGNLSIVLDSAGKQNFTVSYKNQSKKISITVKKQSIIDKYDTNNNNGIERSELRSAIIDFVNQNISKNSVRTVILEYVHSQT